MISYSFCWSDKYKIVSHCDFSLLYPTVSEINHNNIYCHMIFLLKSMYLTICLLGCFLNFKALHILFSMPECFMYCTYLFQFFRYFLCVSCSFGQLFVASGSSVHGILEAKILELVPFHSPGDLPNLRYLCRKNFSVPLWFLLFLQFEKGFLWRLAKNVE